MSRIGLTLTAVAALCAGTSLAHAAPAPAAPRGAPVSVTRMFTGPDGLTHTEIVKVPVSTFQKVAGIQFTRVTTKDPKTAGAFGWHTAPHRRYVVTLSGAARIEVSGEKKIITADRNNIMLAEDTTGKGHRYVAHPVGPEDWVNVFIEVDPPKPGGR